MKLKDLKVGDKVFIREDLVHLQEYGNAVYYKAKGSGKRTISWFYNDNKKDTFVAEEDSCYYTPEMIDWEKTDILRREKMNINDLKVGDKVFIREDLEPGEIYGDYMYMGGMCSGAQQIKSISRDCENFKVFSSFDYFYTPEMIDWDKTIKLRREKMKIKDLKVGDIVYIRDDLDFDKKYGCSYFTRHMSHGIQRINSIDTYQKSFDVSSEANSFMFRYTPEMIDWDKTEELKTITKYDSDTVHNPSHYGGGGIHNIECYKAIEYILDRLENVPEKYYGHISNVIKYIWRCNYKNGYEDLDKASVYFDFMFREED